MCTFFTYTGGALGAPGGAKRERQQQRSADTLRHRIKADSIIYERECRSFRVWQASQLQPLWMHAHTQHQTSY